MKAELRIGSQDQFFERIQLAGKNASKGVVFRKSSHQIAWFEDNESLYNAKASLLLHKYYSDIFKQYPSFSIDESDPFCGEKPGVIKNYAKSIKKNGWPWLIHEMDITGTVAVGINEKSHQKVPAVVMGLKQPMEHLALLKTLKKPPQIEIKVLDHTEVVFVWFLSLPFGCYFQLKKDAISILKQLKYALTVNDPVLVIFPKDFETLYELSVFSGGNVEHIFDSNNNWIYLLRPNDNQLTLLNKVNDTKPNKWHINFHQVA